ncbi:MAG: tetratricopeptide repeat protein [Bacteroidota bacterium]
MKLRQQKSLSFGLLIALFLQSCGIEDPTTEHPQEVVGLAAPQSNLIKSDVGTARSSLERLRQQEVVGLAALQPSLIKSDVGTPRSSLERPRQQEVAGLAALQPNLFRSYVGTARSSLERPRQQEGVGLAALQPSLARSHVGTPRSSLERSRQQEVVGLTALLQPSLIKSDVDTPQSSLEATRRRLSNALSCSFDTLYQSLSWVSSEVTQDSKDLNAEKSWYIVQEQDCVQKLREADAAFTVDQSPANRDKLAQVLLELAALHQEQGKTLRDLRYYTDAAVCYQHVLSICQDQDLMPECESHIQSAYKGLVKIREVLVPVWIDKAKLQAEVARDQQELQWLRDHVRARVADLEKLLDPYSLPEEEIANEEAYIQGSKDLWHAIATQVSAFLARLYRESEAELGPAPCQYAVMGLGAMASKQMTPYSELAFAMLMGECTYQEDARIYYKRLTHLVNFRVINLGETIIPDSRYGTHLKHLIKRGMHFDLRGKTPLGSPDNSCELLQTVAGMLQYLQQAGNGVADTDPNLPCILENTCYVCGDAALYKEYEAAKASFLGDLATRRCRAGQRMLASVVAWDYRHLDVEESASKQPGYPKVFEPQFGVGRLYKANQDIGRTPDQLLCDLALYYGLMPASGWEAITQLFDQGIIKQEAVHHLAYTINFAPMLLLKTYLHYGQRRDHVAILPSPLNLALFCSSVRKPRSLVQEVWRIGDRLSRHYRAAVSLWRELETFFGEPGLCAQMMEADGAELAAWHSLPADTLQKEALSFYDVYDTLRGDMHVRLLQCEEAIDCYKEVLMRQKRLHGDKHPTVAITLQKLGSVYGALGMHAEYVVCYAEALQIERHFYGGVHPEVAHTFSNLGHAHRKLEDLEQSIRCYAEALKIYKQVHGDVHPAVAGTLNDLGAAHGDVQAYDLSRECYVGALQIMKQMHGKIHPRIADTLNDLGNAHRGLKEYAPSHEYYLIALQIMKQVYGGVHPVMVHTLKNLGAVHSNLGNYKKSLAYYSEALQILRQTYSNDDHLEVASVLESLGAIHIYLGNYKKSLLYHSYALEIMKRVGGDRHPGVASILDSLGTLHGFLADYDQSVTCYLAALQIRERIYGLKHPALVNTLSSLGLVYKARHDNTQSLACFEKALEIRQQACADENPQVASLLQNIGEIYQELQDHKTSCRYLETALQALKRVYGDGHPDIAEVLNSLGAVYEVLGAYVKSRECLEEVLCTWKQQYGPTHLKVVRTLNKLGTLHSALRAYTQSRACYEEALQIMQQADVRSISTVVDILKNLGAVHRTLGDHAQSLLHFVEMLRIKKQVRPISIKGRMTLLGVVVRGGQLGMIQRMLTHGVAIDKPICRGKTLLNLAAYHGHQNVVRYLLSRGANALLPDDRGWTALHSAAYNGHVQVVQYLQAQGVPGDIRTHDGWTPMHIAAYQGHLEVVQYLQAQGVPGDISDNDGWTPVHMAAQNGHVKLVEDFTARGVKVNDPDSYGVTPLLMAVCNGHLGVVKHCMTHLTLPHMPAQNSYLGLFRRYMTQPSRLASSCPSNLGVLPYVAIRQGHLAIAVVLLRHGIEMDTHMGARVSLTLAHLYHIVAVECKRDEQEDLCRAFLVKAKNTFERMLVAQDTPTPSQCTRYGSFLLATEQMQAAYRYLQQALALGDDGSVFTYSWLERVTIAPTLRNSLDPAHPLSLRVLDYAYYLLVHYYEDFRAAGVQLGKTRETYLEDYRQAIKQQLGQTGREQEDTVARYLLKSLEKEVGDYQSEVV